MTVARVSQAVVESLSQATAKARLSQAVVESVSQVTAVARVSQMVVEVISSEYGPPGQIKPPPWQRGSIRGNSYLAPRG